MLVGALTMMFVTSPTLAALALAAIPAIVFPLLAYGRAVRRLSRAAQDRLADASAYAADNLGAVRTMHAFGQEATVSGRFAAAVERAFDAARSRLLARAGLTAIAIFLVVASIVGILWFGSRLVISGRDHRRPARPVRPLCHVRGRRHGRARRGVGRAGAGGRRGRAAAGAAGGAARGQRARRAEAAAVPPRGTIAFEDVRFAYPSRPGASALNGVSFAVERGETVAVVGPSGAGKSTIFNLILRFYDPAVGSVSRRRRARRTKPTRRRSGRASPWCRRTSPCSTTPSPENIRYGRPDAGDAEVRAGGRGRPGRRLHRRACPRATRTRLGERGVTLSGGQRQRIALARAMLRDAPILLLDEATSALDAESEVAVQKALARISEGRTTLVIAHRLATVQRATPHPGAGPGRHRRGGPPRRPAAPGRPLRRLAELQFALDAAQ